MGDSLKVLFWLDFPSRKLDSPLLESEKCNPGNALKNGLGFFASNLLTKLREESLHQFLLKPDVKFSDSEVFVALSNVLSRNDITEHLQIDWNMHEVVDLRVSMKI